MHEATRPNVLLIDDCIEQRDLYELALERDFKILTATRGAEGAALAARERPDAIVLDVMMPGIDGWETCSQIKGNVATADIPVIMLTGTEDCDLSLHAVEVGASALLRKPCPVDRLRDTIFITLTECALQRQAPPPRLDH